MESISQTSYRFTTLDLRADVATDPPHKVPSNRGAVERLVAARVDGDPMSSIRTLDTTSAPIEPTRLELYRHPADKNTAATGVYAGRTLDVQA